MDRSTPSQELSKTCAALQSHLAWQTLAVRARGPPAYRRAVPASQSVVRVDAIESYVRGLLATSADQKLKYFTQAVRLDPKYSHAKLRTGSSALPTQELPAGRRLPSESRPQRTFTIVRLPFCSDYRAINLGEFPAAERAFHIVAQQVPLNEVLNNLGAAQSRQNRAGAIENFKKALEGDAADPVTTSMSVTRCCKGDLDAAAEKFRAVSIAIPTIRRLLRCWVAV